MARVSSGSDSKQDYGTPAIFTEACQAKFGPLVFDLAATPVNAVTPSFFDFSKGEDAFKSEWPRQGLCWLNPPYSSRDDSPHSLADWTKRCKEQAALGTELLFLVPAAVGSNWFRDNVASAADVYLLNGRIAFVGETAGYTKDMMLCHYGPYPLPLKIGIWRWTEDTEFMTWEASESLVNQRELFFEALKELEIHENIVDVADRENPVAAKIRKLLGK